LVLPGYAGLSREKNYDSQQTLGTIELLALGERRDLEMFARLFFSQKCRRVHLAPRAGRGKRATAPREYFPGQPRHARGEVDYVATSSPPSAPEKFAELIRSESVKWGKLIADAGIKSQ
jgi:hypothetical protein